MTFPYKGSPRSLCLNNMEEFIFAFWGYLGVVVLVPHLVVLRGYPDFALRDQSCGLLGNEPVSAVCKASALSVLSGPCLEKILNLTLPAESTKTLGHHRQFPEVVVFGGLWSLESGHQGSG